MDFYYVGEKLAEQLNGRTLFTSRVKERNINGYFATLHSIVYRVLRKNSTYKNANALNEKLSGQEMYTNVKNAVAILTGGTPSKEQVLHYYYRLRSHQNYGANINTLHEGNVLINNYQTIKEDKMDWEESMQLATWYLKQDRVHSIENFNFDNIILLRPELLNQKRNKNALDFFLALSQWSVRHTNLNIYYVTYTGKIYHYVNGKYEPLNINFLGDCQVQSPFSM